MEELNKCLGCMEDLQGYPCPHCGYDPSAAPKLGYALPGQTILHGRYLVGRVLGQGGFGLTYVGWDISLCWKVAIKEFYPTGQVSRIPGDRTITWYQTEQSQQAQQSGMEMFLKEARKMARVDTIPGVVRVRDLFRENETAYIVMDFVEGETLKSRLQKTGPMPWNQAKEIFLPAIRSMERVHKKGLIHRDLSPDNLMLTTEGEVEILDLGAAKDLSISTGASSMQVAKGGFSPLEQYTQRGGSGTWTDVYAMAATIYYTLTGILPPPAVDRVDEDTLSWDAPQLRSLPESVLETLKKAMVLSAKKRLQTMGELEAGLIGKTREEPVWDPAPKPIWNPVREMPPRQEPVPKPAVEPVPKSIRAVRAASIAAGSLHTVGLRSDGTVVAAGRNDVAQCDVGSWRDIVSVAAGSSHTVGLRSDGIVLATGFNKEDQCEVGNWRNIVAIAAGTSHTVGLRGDGTVVAAGRGRDGQCDVGSWKNVVQIAANGYQTVGLCENGTVLSTGYDSYGQSGASAWRNIVSIAVGGGHTVGLRRDGTVIAAGNNSYGQCNVENWKNIVALAAGGGYTMGLRKDGTVVAAGLNDSGQCVVGGWWNIVSIATGKFHAVGLRGNGVVVVTGSNGEGQCNVFGWNNIRVYEHS